MFTTFKNIFRPAAVITGIQIALIVGLLLNVINQGDLILNGNWQAINWAKFTLTFFVPFGVSVYSAWQARERMDKLLEQHNLPNSTTLANTAPQ